MPENFNPISEAEVYKSIQNVPEYYTSRKIVLE